MPINAVQIVLFQKRSGQKKSLSVISELRFLPRLLGYYNQRIVPSDSSNKYSFLTKDLVPG